MASTSGFSHGPGSWEWPEELPDLRQRTDGGVKLEEERTPTPTRTRTPTSPPAGRERHETNSVPQNGEANKAREKHWRPRTCRICLETVNPTYEPPSENMPEFLQSRPRIRYESESGRLIKPCKCKGTQKYVHTDCLSAWRHASFADRNYYHCPTCGYKYKLRRLGWGRLISSVAAQVFLTLFLMLTVVFILGFISDTVIDFALDPWGYFLPSWGNWGSSFGGVRVYSFGSLGSGSFQMYDGDYSRAPLRHQVPDIEPSGWIEHFVKGFASLGLVSLLKFMLSRPLQFMFRGGARGRATGRDRLDGITWIMIVVGVATFLYGLWKLVRNVSRKALERVGESVMDVPGNEYDDDDEDDEDEATTVPPRSSVDG